MFCFRLAKDLGLWDVPRLMREMPAALAAEWRAFYELEVDAAEEAQMEADVRARAER